MVEASAQRAAGHAVAGRAWGGRQQRSGRHRRRDNCAHVGGLGHDQVALAHMALAHNTAETDGHVLGTGVGRTTPAVCDLEDYHAPEITSGCQRMARQSTGILPAIDGTREREQKDRGAQGSEGPPSVRRIAIKGRENIAFRS